MLLGMLITLSPCPSTYPPSVSRAICLPVPLFAAQRLPLVCHGIAHPHDGEIGAGGRKAGGKWEESGRVKGTVLGVFVEPASLLSAWEQ